MKLFTIHKNPLNISYKHQLCSTGALFVLLVMLLVVVLPFVLIQSLYKDLWKAELLLFEQPNAKFSFKYVFRSFLKNELTGDEELVTCSSFSTYNSLTESSQKCNEITFNELDKNNDHLLDEMTFTFKFNKTPEYHVVSISVLMFIDTVVKNQCEFTIPAVIVVDKDFATSQDLKTTVTQGINIEVKGSLLVKQQRALTCPLFLKNIKTHFFHNLIRANSTSIRDYSVDAVKERLETNPVFLRNFEDSLRITKLTKDENVNIDIKLQIGDIMLRYKYTLWQVLNRMWIEYLSVFIVFYLLGEKVKDYVFRNQYLAAWEIIPWKKLR